MTDITWKTTVCPDAILGAPYEASLAVTGNATVFTAATVSSGALPTGLSLNADHVRITGTPSGALGVYTFKVTLTDTAGGVQSGTFTINLRDAVPADAVGLGANKYLADIARLRFS